MLSYYDFTFLVPCCDVRYAEAMFGSSLPPVVGWRAQVVFAYSGVQHILCYVFCLVLFLFVLCPVLPGSLDCLFLIATLVSLTFIYLDITHLFDIKLKFLLILPM